MCVFGEPVIIGGDEDLGGEFVSSSLKSWVSVLVVAIPSMSKLMGKCGAVAPCVKTGTDKDYFPVVEIHTIDA
ncbi:hypothetical protein AOT31_00835 [Corynebacterium ulcerans]|nr:hypothetical protein AOT31_00835 [Corynebacterium ulcerans]